MDRVHATGADSYSYLQSVWENINIQYFSDFVKLYNHKNVIPTLEAMQKIIEFYHNKVIDMLYKLDVHYLNWPIFVCINRQIQNFIPVQSRIKICLRRYEKIWLAVFLLSLHVKL